jgi:hypothetical protein
VPAADHVADSTLIGGADFTAIYFGTVLYVIVAEIHIWIRTCLRFWLEESQP